MYSNPTGLFNLTVPDKQAKPAVGYTNLTYSTWKMQQLRDAWNAAEDDDAPRPQLSDIITKNWLSDRSRANCILRVMVKNKISRMQRISIKMTVADNEKKNVNFPISTLKDTCFSQDPKQVFVFTKIDPTKEEWGDIDIEVSVKGNKPISTSTTSGGIGSSYGYSGTTSINTGTGGMNFYEGGNYSWNRADDDDIYNSPKERGGGIGGTSGGGYKPFGYTEDGDTTVICRHCEAECYAGQDWCGTCGKCPTDDDYDDVGNNI